MTSGQQDALEQLEEIAAFSEGLLEIVSIGKAASDNEWLPVNISYDCGSFKKTGGGLPLRKRERFLLLIPPDFPFEVPGIWCCHARFADFPHVQWKAKLCLYQAPATEWDCSDGMYGFLGRLSLWLERGARGEWETVGEALHPPVAYTGSFPVKMVIPRVDTPPVKTTNWYGFAHLNIISDHRVDIVGWSEFNEPTPTNVGAAILLSQPMPFEFPSKVKDLFGELETRGVDQDRLLLMLLIAVLSNDDGDPLYFVIGTPARGIRGSAEIKQHLTVWYMNPDIADLLRIYRAKYSSSEELKEIGKKVEDFIKKWAQSADVQWCTVKENRPEIVIRRDHESPIGYFDGRTISLWGCGALGGYVAEYLTRAGAKKLILRDNGLVGPGILVRQPYDDRDIGRSKVDALADRLRRIRPEIELQVERGNILTGPLNSDDFSEGAEILIDTTASESVLSKLELKRRDLAKASVPIISMAISSHADRGLLTISGATFSGGPFDVARRTKLEACNRDGLSDFVNEFWPSTDGPRRQIFQPEPGCSDSTFVGSAADVSALSSTMLNLAARDLNTMGRDEAHSHFVASPQIRKTFENKIYSYFEWSSDLVYQDPHADYEIRVSKSAWRDILGWVEKSRRNVGPSPETGGLLFGERDDATKIIWITEILGPPPDSQAQSSHFICGVDGTREANDEKKRRTKNSVQYTGMWHTHPGGSPRFSVTDLEGMRQLIEDAALSPSKLVLLIIGTPDATPNVATYVFKRSDFIQLRTGSYTRLAVSKQTRPATPNNRIGLALSGGGSRAIAFHLGCLRAMHDRGLLSQVKVISSVSGGSVVNGMYSYSDDDFDAFDARVCELLRRGLARSILREAVLSRVLFSSIGTNLIAGTSAVAAGLLSFGITGCRIVGVDGEAISKGRKKFHAPLSRWTSVTSAFEQALKSRLFGETLIADKRRGDVQTVINACELRTGAAFRFGSGGSGCWRFGSLKENRVSLATAVAASAAYPILLPAIDRSFDFVDNAGKEGRKRVIITDGGIFDNLGVTCLEPGRSRAFSQQAFDLDYIICCDAGQGIYDDDVYPYYWPGRMIRSFEAVYRKANDGVRARMYEHVNSGRLKGFVLSYLGQIDTSLPYRPPDLVRRGEVYKYPTNFSPMAEADIKRLSSRGEQLTRMLIARYCPEL